MKSEYERILAKIHGLDGRIEKLEEKRDELWKKTSKTGEVLWARIGTSGRYANLTLHDKPYAVGVEIGDISGKNAKLISFAGRRLEVGPEYIGNNAFDVFIGDIKKKYIRDLTDEEVEYLTAGIETGRERHFY